MINDDEQILYIDIIKYTSDESSEYENREMTAKGIYVKQIKYTLIIGDNDIEIIKDFLDYSYDIYCELLFDDVDDGRIKKFYSPDLELTDKNLCISKLYSFLY